MSVVIPAFNRAYVIGEAIESVLQQSYPHVEAIVADDGSQDDTRRVVEAFGPRVRYCHQTNAGVSAARNLGLRHARGAFIAFLDSDDSWLPWKAQAQVAFLRHAPQLGMVWTDMQAVDAGGAVIAPTYLRSFYHAYRQVRLEDICTPAGAIGTFWGTAPPAIADRPTYWGSIFSHMLLGNLVHTSTAMLRRSRLRVVGGFDETLRVSGEDYEYHLRTTFAGPVGFLDVASIRYRVGADDQLTAPQYMIDVAKNNVATVTRWLSRGGDRIDLPRGLLARRLGEAYGWLAREEYHHGDQPNARRHFFMSFSHRPRPAVAAWLVATLLPRSWVSAARTLLRQARPRRASSPPSQP